LLDRVEI